MLEKFTPKGRKQEAERKAGESVEAAYSELGGTSGLVVDSSQMLAVINAEVELLVAQGKDTEVSTWKRALDFQFSRPSKIRAKTFFTNKAVYWDKKAESADGNEKVEFLRRRRACTQIHQYLKKQIEPVVVDPYSYRRSPRSPFNAG